MRAYAFNWEEGLSWSTPRVTYAIDSTVPRSWWPAIHRAAETWSRACADFALVYDSVSPNRVALEGLSNGLVAWTEVHHPRLETRITGCVTKLNQGQSFSASGVPLSRQYDLETVMLHEFGHWLKLEHKANPGCVMNGTMVLGRVRRGLTLDDIAGIRAIYPPSR